MLVSFVLLTLPYVGGVGKEARFWDERWLPVGLLMPSLLLLFGCLFGCWLAWLGLEGLSFMCVSPGIYATYLSTRDVDGIAYLTN